MKLLFLHGPPASGKRTVAEAIIQLAGGRMFDNHAAVDFARTLFDFDQAGFWGLVHASRMVALEKAAQHDVRLVVHTSCYSHPDDLPLVEDFERLLASHGGSLLPVFLSCSRGTLEQRVGSPDRVARGKVTSREGLDRCLSRWNLVPVPRDNCLTVDTDALSPAEAARAIVAHFGLASHAAPEVIVSTERLDLVLESTEAVLARIDAMSPEDRAEVSPDWLARMRAATAQDPWTHGLVMVERGGGTIVGNAAFKGPPDADGVVEIAYVVEPDHRGRGYATEAATGLVAFAYRDPGVRLVIAHTQPENGASARVLTKCGFQFGGDVVDPEDGPVWRWERTR